MAIEKPTTLLKMKDAHGPVTHGGIVALDPGETTGIAIALFSKLVTDPTTLLVNAKLLELNHSPHSQRVLSQIIHELASVVVWERFMLYPDKAKQQTGSTFIPVQVIGGVQMLAAQKEIPTANYPAGSTKSISVDELRYTWNLSGDYKFKSLHQRDALRTLQIYLMKNFKDDYKRGFKE